MTRTLETLFVTKTYRSDLAAGVAFIADLEEACRQIAQQDKAGTMALAYGE